MKEGNGGLITFFGLVFGLALVGGVLFTVWLIRESLLPLMAVLVGGVTLAIVLVAAAVPIRAYRKSDANPVVEHHHYHEGTKEVRILDNRPQAPAYLPAPQPGVPLLTSDMLRAAFLAGRLELGAGQTVDQDQDGGDGWNGTINPQ